MQIWVDADACPAVIKEILFRAAERTGRAHDTGREQAIAAPVAQNVRFLQVPAGFDAADKRIVELMEPDDLVVTADVPLAAAAIDKAGLLSTLVVSSIPRRTCANGFPCEISWMELRSGGVNTGGPAALSQRERQLFANQLDRWLAKRAKSAGAS